MGLMTGSGCLSRVMGPVFVSYIYTRLGTNWTFGMTTLMMAVALVILLFYRERLYPPVILKEVEMKDLNSLESNVKDSSEELEKLQTEKTNDS
jgi:MFS transporter, ceroid-lipofuscinosis neuronal protein 7